MATRTTLIERIRTKINDWDWTTDALNMSNNLSTTSTSAAVDDGTKFKIGDLIEIGARNEVIKITEAPMLASYINEGAELSASDTTITCLNGGGTFTANDYIKIDNEIMQATTVPTATSAFDIVVTRGMQGTEAVAHDNASSIFRLDWIKMERGYQNSTACSAADNDVVYATDMVTTKEVKQAADDAIRALYPDNYQDFEQYLYTDTDTINEGAEFSSTDTTLTVTTGTKFTAGDYIQIDDEVLYVSAVATNDLTVSRAQVGTVAAAHDDGSTIYILTQTDDDLLSYDMPAGIYHIDTVRIVDPGTTLQTQTDQNYEEADAWGQEDDKLRFRGPYGSGYLIWINGNKKFSVPTTDSTDVPFADEEEEMVVTYGAIKCVEKLMVDRARYNRYSVRLQEQDSSIHEILKLKRELEDDYSRQKDRYAKPLGGAELDYGSEY